MPKIYTKKKIIEQFLHKEKDKYYYQKDCLNVSSKTKKEDGDNEEYCVEIIACLLNNGTTKLNYYKKDDQILFQDNFHFKDHDGNYGTSKASEKALCRNWYNKGFPTLKNIEGKEIQLGEIIDYESNLIKRKKVNIDLTSVNGNTMYLIEVKGEKGSGTCYYTNQTLLKAALEINTYYKTLKENVLLDNFKRNLASKNKTIEQEIIDVKKVIIFPDNPNDFAYGTMIKNKKDFPEVYKYIQKNEIIVLTFDKKYKFRD